MSTGRWTPVENWEGTRADWQRRDVPGVAVDAEDTVYVFSRDEENPVTVYGSDGARIRAWGTGVFKRPHAIRIDADGFVWCVDDGDHTVRKFTREGELLMMLGQPERPSENGAGSADGTYGTFDYRDVSRGGPPFNGPTDVCILSDGTVFVTDGYGNARVHRFSPDGGLELSWGQPGSGPGEFRLPHGIVAAPEQDRLFVLDRENNRVQVFDRDGRFLEQWTHFVRPCGIAISRDGMLCIVELGERAGRWPHMAPLTPDTRTADAPSSISAARSSSGGAGPIPPRSGPSTRRTAPLSTPTAVSTSPRSLTPAERTSPTYPTGGIRCRNSIGSSGPLMPGPGRFTRSAGTHRSAASRARPRPARRPTAWLPAPLRQARGPAPLVPRAPGCPRPAD